MRIPGFKLAPLQALAFPDWWERAEEDTVVEEYSNYALGCLYASIALVALIQLIRIQLRVPEYGWTTQKVFHLLNCFVCLLRAGSFLFRSDCEQLPYKYVIYDLPGLLFFTTYTLLVLFWAEIYHQARSMPTSSLRPIFIGFNVFVYVVQIGLWVFMGLSAAQRITRLQELATVLAAAFMAFVCLLAAAGFLVYGGRLFLMLRRFPIESRGRRKKLREVGLVTTICTLCFFMRALLVALSVAEMKELALDVYNHPVVNAVYYSLVEVIPSSCVLFILRKLPPKRHHQGYQQISTR